MSIANTKYAISAQHRCCINFIGQARRHCRCTDHAQVIVGFIDLTVWSDCVTQFLPSDQLAYTQTAKQFLYWRTGVQYSSNRTAVLTSIKGWV